MFGSLMDLDILSAVLGREVDPNDLGPAKAPGFRRVRISGVSYPALLPSAAASTEGLLVENLSERDVALLAKYEGTNYVDAPIDVVTPNGKSAKARYWRWIGKRPTLDREWDFEEWRRTGKMGLLPAAKSVGRTR